MTLQLIGRRMTCARVTIMHDTRICLIKEFQRQWNGIRLVFLENSSA